MPDSRGDPEGRRLAKERAERLSEASRLARLLAAMLRRAGEEGEVCAQLIESIQVSERQALQRAHGWLDSRRAFKLKSGQPLSEGRSENVLYIDESGVAAPEPRLAESWFAIGAAAISPEDISAYEELANSIKRDFFGTTDITLHEPHMRRRRDHFFFDDDPARQRAFDDAIRQLIADVPAVFFGVGVRKTQFQQFIDAGQDPYLPADAYSLAITMLLERYIDYLANLPNRAVGRVTFESIGPREDALRQAAVVDLLLGGTQWISESAFRGMLHTGVLYAPKRGTDVTELADIVAREVYEWVSSGCTREPKYWEVVSGKFYRRGDGQMGKFGLKVFPDSDIRPLIQAHRRFAAPKR